MALKIIIQNWSDLMNKPANQYRPGSSLEKLYYGDWSGSADCGCIKLYAADGAKVHGKNQGGNGVCYSLSADVGGTENLRCR